MKYDDRSSRHNPLKIRCEQIADRSESYHWKETEKTSEVVWDRLISGTNLFRQPWHNRLQNIRLK